MNIQEALKQVRWENAMYFKYKFPDLAFDKSKPLKTEEQFLKSVQRQTMNSFYRWEKTDQYKMLVTLYLNTKAIQDYEDIYKIVSEQAKKGDEKSIKLFIQLQKDLQQQSKLAKQYFTKVNEVADDDGLSLEV